MVPELRLPLLWPKPSTSVVLLFAGVCNPTFADRLLSNDPKADFLDASFISCAFILFVTHDFTPARFFIGVSLILLCGLDSVKSKIDTAIVTPKSAYVLGVYSSFSYFQLH